jgi:oligoendopeptidase F
MSEDAERIVAMKDATGKHAWNQLYSEVTAGLLFPVEVDGETKKLTRSEANALRQSPDRALRERAVQSLADGHRAHEAVLTFVFNTIFEDHRAESAARGYPDALRFTVLQDDLDPEVVESLLQTTLAWGSIPRRWHALRKARLGLDDYGTEDLLAPAFGAPGTVSWDAAKAMTLDAFARFHPEAHEVARTLFDERRADVYPRPGKRSGAFCSPTLPPEPPFVMLNHADQLSDAMTCAHELGHALHFTLSLEQQPLVYWTGTSLAETASVFAELWLHDVLIERAQTDEERLRLLANQVEDAVGTAFRQVAYVDWERKAHALRAEGVVTAAEYAAIWERSMRWLHGDAVRVRERDGYGWLSVPHFIFARFYCYSYAFGKMLTLALYDLWKERGAAFVDAYLDMLRSGGSRSPRELVARLGVDLADPKFWERGCRVVDSWLDTLGAEKVA